MEWMKRAEMLQGPLEQAGYDASVLDLDGLCSAERLSPETLDLLVLPDAGTLPVDAAGPLRAFLEGGGNLIVFNPPLWQKALVKDNGTWVDSETLRDRMDASLLSHIVFDFAEQDLETWQRGSNEMSTAVIYEKAEGQPKPIGTALHADLAFVNGWDVFTRSNLSRPFPDANTLTVFYAKGSDKTKRLAIEWEEQDGSRWIATVPLTAEWRQYILAPEDFKFWESVPSRANDPFRPENAARFSVGVSKSHTQLDDGPQEYWMGPVGTASITPAHERMLAATRLPETLTRQQPSALFPGLDGIYPAYKVFECRDVATLEVSPAQSVLSPIDLDVPDRVCSIQPRPGAGGFDKGREWRWLPLVQAWSAGGTWRGAPAALIVHGQGTYQGGVWATFCGDAWFRADAAAACVRDVAVGMAHGVYLIDGGANYYTYFDDQVVTLGARVANTGRTMQDDLQVRIELTDEDTGRSALQLEFPLTLKPGEMQSVSEPFQPAAWPAKGYRVDVELVANGKVVDRAGHEVHVWRPKAAKQFVSVRDGHFEIDGQLWRPHGVNYMPSSGIGTEDGLYFEHWMGARSYDPDIIERDLEHVKDMGLDAVSIFIHRDSLEAQNLLDLLRRLDAMGLKANLSLRPGTPMDYDWKPIHEIIEHYRLWDNDCIFAYDLDWEPVMGNHATRTKWDNLWRTWIIERYASIDNAEKDWDYAVPRDASGAVTNPSDEQITQNGAWRRMVAAYRRFVDVLVYEKYSAARRLVLGVDPNHFVSFRMNEAGSPRSWGDVLLPYDFAYLGGAVDVFEPEGYGRIGDWERVKTGIFTRAYARWANPAIPMFWAEAGLSALAQGSTVATDEGLERQASLYRDFYRMFAASSPDGIFWWWYPGGYRVGEASDYGIINPDGTDRPVTKVIRDNAQPFRDMPPLQPVDQWIAMDRDADARGLTGIYGAVEEPFWAAVEAGQTPGFRTMATGTTSSDCPLTAVGNTPYDGNNPPKHLDGFFDIVEVRDAQGNWVHVEKGDTVEVAPGVPVRLRIALTNLGEALWLATGADGEQVTGAVRILANGPWDTAAFSIERDMARFDTATIEGISLPAVGQNAESTVTLRLEAQGRAQFGPRFVVTMKGNAPMTTEAQLEKRALVSMGDTTRLERVLTKARAGEPVTIGVIGGSITGGASASSEENRWGNRVAQWWRETFPGSEIAFVNAGIGATGSDMAAHRAQRDLLRHNPDFVVVEFAVNDGINAHPAETLEGLVRQILSWPTQPAVMQLFTMNNQGQNTQDAHERVGRHYGLPMVSFRDAYWPEVASGRITWEDIEADTVHPNDRGHGYCAQLVTSVLDCVLAEAPAADAVPEPAPLPEPLISDVFEYTAMLTSETTAPVENQGWTPCPSRHLIGPGWTSSTPGSTIRFEFEGDSAALVYYRVKGDVGMAKARADERAPIELDAYFPQDWGGGFTPYAFVARDLGPGTHTLTVEVLDKKDPKSNAHEFTVCAVMIGGVPEEH
jgi:lysophospholipase L1-like esterase